MWGQLEEAEHKTPSLMAERPRRRLWRELLSHVARSPPEAGCHSAPATVGPALLTERTCPFAFTGESRTLQMHVVTVLVTEPLLLLMCD